MTDTQHPEQPEGEDDSARDDSAREQEAPEQEVSAEQEVATAGQQSTESQHSGTDDGESQDSAQQPTDEHGDPEGQSDQPASEGETTGQNSGKKKTGLLVGLAGSAVVVIAALLVAAFVWPGFLAGPGDPDDKASEVTAAWGSKNPGQLDEVSCTGPSGKVAKYPPQVMNLVQSVKQTGPAQMVLDTEATVPIDMTLSAQGQTQKLPANVVLGVTDGEWCMKGLQPRK